MEGKYKFGVLGVGPSGGIMAAHLSRAGHHVVLVDILKSHLDAIKEHGLILTGYKDMNARFLTENICYSIEELKHQNVNVVFVAVKASYLELVVPQLAKVLKPGTILISLQNGMGTESFIAETFGAHSVLRIVINYAGNLISDGTIRYTFFNAPNYIGVIDPSRKETAEDVAAVLTGAGMETEFTSKIQKHVWEKVLLNSALSAVCSLTRKTMAQIMNYDTTKALVINILREGIDVARASGIEIEDGFFDFSIDYLSKGGNHYPSMHFDLERGNPTEIDYINGKLVEHGVENNVPTPFNSTIVSLIKGMELS